jgi:predicted N-acetyltransferase YhbS
MKILEPTYQIRSARAEELVLLSHIERSAARLFLDTPYSFLADAGPLSLNFLQQQFQSERVWVAVHLHHVVVGYAIACEVDNTLYLQQIDVVPEHGRRGIGSSLVSAVCDQARRQGYAIVSLSTFRDIPWNAPFYAKLGFCAVDETELTPGFQYIRLKEKAAGLPIGDRVIMWCILPPPNHPIPPKTYENSVLHHHKP